MFHWRWSRLSTANDQHELRNELCLATRGTANDFLSLPRSHSHLCLIKSLESLPPRGWFLFVHVQVTSCCSWSNLAVCFPLTSSTKRSRNVVHILSLKQNLHKILLLLRGIASGDRYEILRNEFWVSRREFETVGLILPEISGRTLRYFKRLNRHRLRSIDGQAGGTLRNGNEWVQTATWTQRLLLFSVKSQEAGVFTAKAM